MKRWTWKELYIQFTHPNWNRPYPIYILKKVKTQQHYQRYDVYPSWVGIRLKILRADWLSNENRIDRNNMVKY